MKEREGECVLAPTSMFGFTPVQNISFVFCLRLCHPLSSCGRSDQQLMCHPSPKGQEV